MILDVAAISPAQVQLLSHLGNAFSTVSNWSLNLLYIFAVFEVVMFGLLWAFSAESNWGRLFFKVIKIGLIFFVLQAFVHLLGLVVSSFADVGGVSANTANLGDIVFNPAVLWKYGYNSSLALLKSGAVAKNSFGLALIQVSLGLGSLICFALIGIQVVLQLVAFYFVSLMALLLMPFGVFSPASNFFENSVTTILKAGVRVAVLIFVVGMAVTTWELFGLSKTTLPVSVNQALGLFDTALLFAFLAIRLPGMVAKVVGKLQFDRWGSAAPVVNVSGQSAVASTVVSQSAASNLQAATAIAPGQTALGQASQVTPAAQAATNVSVNTPSISIAAAGGKTKRDRKADMAEAYAMNKSISDDLLRKLKEQK